MQIKKKYIVIKKLVKYMMEICQYFGKCSHMLWIINNKNYPLKKLRKFTKRRRL